MSYLSAIQPLRTIDLFCLLNALILAENIDVQVRDFSSLLKHLLRYPLVLFCHLVASGIGITCGMVLRALISAYCHEKVKVSLYHLNILSDDEIWNIIM